MPRSPRKAGRPEPSTMRPLRMTRSSMGFSSGKDVEQTLPGLAAEIVGRLRIALFEKLPGAAGIERDGAERAVLVAHAHLELGLAVVPGHDVRARDDRLSRHASPPRAAARRRSRRCRG